MNSEKFGLSMIEKIIVAVIPFVLAILFYFLPSILQLVKKIPFLSDNQLVLFISQIGDNWIIWLLTGIGFVIGIFVSLYIYSEILKVEVHRDSVIIDIHDKKTEVQKSDVGSVFKDGKKLVIANNNGLELLRETTDLKFDFLKDTFQKYHYPWKESDPFHDDFQEWSISTEGLNQKADDILYERRNALRNGDDKKVRMLRDDLREIGIVVKDKGSSQYIRIVDKH